MTGPRSPEEYGAGFTDQELEADGWAVGLDVWGQVQKAYEPDSELLAAVERRISGGVTG